MKNSGILLTVKLKGKIGGPVKHTEKQNITVDISPVGSKRPEWSSRKITHNDRSEQECCRKCMINENIVKSWENSECPYWEHPVAWKNFSEEKKVQSFLSRYDEGYGISYEYIEQ